MTITDWDAYWEKELEDELSHRTRLPISPFLRFVTFFENSWRRVLIAGCGISTESALLAHLGYEVVAFDMSRVAIEHLLTHPATETELANWLTHDLPKTAWRQTKYGAMTLALKGKALRKAQREMLELRAKPGSLTISCASFREFVCDQPFDVVYSPWSWQCLDDVGREELPRQAFEWLAPGGACLFATQNLSPPLDSELASACAAAGLLRRHEAGINLLAEKWPSNEEEWKRVNDTCDADDLEMRAKLAAGAKMWDLFGASG